MSLSIAERMAVTKGRATGFDYLRVILALSVIIWHSFPLSYGPQFSDAFQSTVWRPVVTFILPMFFALSGFLVAGSLERNRRTIATFVGLRAIRILPALGVEVLLSALILGPALTVVPLSSYFSDHKFAAYFLNILGDIHYKLPGLFLSNPYPDVVNGQLWTVPWELRCYLVLTVLALLGVVSRKFLYLVVVIVGTIAAYSWASYKGHLVDQSHGVLGTALLVAFLAAVAVYNFRTSIPWNKWLFAISTLIMIALLIIPGGDYFVGFFAAYSTIYLGLLNPRKIALLRGADYSYGLYLYGFAIAQAVSNIWPATHEWYLNLAITIPIAALFAAFSWTVIEKPALETRKLLPHLESAISRLTNCRSGGQKSEKTI